MNKKLIFVFCFLTPLLIYSYEGVWTSIDNQGENEKSYLIIEKVFDKYLLSYVNNELIEDSFSAWGELINHEKYGSVIGFEAYGGDLILGEFSFRNYESLFMESVAGSDYGYLDIFIPFDISNNRFIGVVNDDTVNVRRTPSLSGTILCSLVEGDQVLLKKRSPNKMKIGNSENYWYEIEYGENNNIGWIFGSLIDFKENR